MNTGELKKLMIDNGDNNRTLSKALNMQESTFSSKLHEKGASFRKCEMQKIINRYNMSAAQIKEVFFN